MGNKSNDHKEELSPPFPDPQSNLFDQPKFTVLDKENIEEKKNETSIDTATSFITVKHIAVLFKKRRD